MLCVDFMRHSVSCSNAPTPTAEIIYYKPSHTHEHTQKHTYLYSCLRFARQVLISWPSIWIEPLAKYVHRHICLQTNSAATAGAKLKAGCQLLMLTPLPGSCFWRVWSRLNAPEKQRLSFDGSGVISSRRYQPRICRYVPVFFSLCFILYWVSAYAVHSPTRVHRKVTKQTTRSHGVWFCLLTL